LLVGRSQRIFSSKRIGVVLPGRADSIAMREIAREHKEEAEVAFSHCYMLEMETFQEMRRIPARAGTAFVATLPRTLTLLRLWPLIGRPKVRPPL
jgi:hypothetical protein